ncbi:hypothetical protein FGO68_gene2657 [Halteria grandinella]|uniref:Uncharacterized protein n=1 Tax=Halteria grandinella TaxID=5974 RepID=A0A8J8SWH6_HALGN|nr:hypothetical protein FGO68_gene2657 [Halteria grandinella]
MKKPPLERRIVFLNIIVYLCCIFQINIFCAFLHFEYRFIAQWVFIAAQQNFGLRIISYNGLIVLSDKIVSFIIEIIVIAGLAKAFTLFQGLRLDFVIISKFIADIQEVFPYGCFFIVLRVIVVQKIEFSH